MKLVDEISVEARINTRISHLEGERVFGSAKRKLDLPPGARVTLIDTTLLTTPFQSWGRAYRRHRIKVCYNSSVKPTQSSIDPETSSSSFLAKVVCIRAGLPILETRCSNPMG